MKKLLALLFALALTCSVAAAQDNAGGTAPAAGDKKEMKDKKHKKHHKKHHKNNKMDSEAAPKQ